VFLSYCHTELVSVSHFSSNVIASKTCLRGNPFFNSLSTFLFFLVSQVIFILQKNKITKLTLFFQSTKFFQNIFLTAKIWLFTFSFFLVSQVIFILQKNKITKLTLFFQSTKFFIKYFFHTSKIRLFTFTVS